MVGTGMFDVCEDLNPPKHSVIKKMTSESIIQSLPNQKSSNKIIYGKA